MSNSIDIPSKAPLTVSLSESADKLLHTIAEIVAISKTTVVRIDSRSGSISNTFWFDVQSVVNGESRKTGDLYGLPVKELELFNFIIPLSNNVYHITPLAIERVKYLNAGGLRRFWMRTTSVQALFAALITLLAMVFAALAFVVNLLNNIRQLLQ
jgi:hypothetical protein